MAALTRWQIWESLRDGAISLATFLGVALLILIALVIAVAILQKLGVLRSRTPVAPPKV